MKPETIEAAGAAPADPACFVERAPLLAALDLVCRVVERRNTIPILSNVALGLADDGGLSLIATDLDVQLELAIPARWKAPGTFTVAAAELRGLVKQLEAAAEVSLSVESGRLLVTAGRARFQLPTLPIDDFPVISTAVEREAARFALPSAQVRRDLAALAPAMSNEETRYYLNGIALQERAGCLCLVATDGHQMASIRRTLPEIEGPLPDVVIPRKAVAIVQALLKKAPDQPLSVEMDESRLVIAGIGFRLISKLIDGTFPDWQAARDKSLGDFGLQRVAMIELEPRLNAPMIAALAKGAGVSLSVETGESAALLTAPDFPEYEGVVMFMLMREDQAPRGYGPNEYDHADRHALAYLEELARRYELPALQRPEHVHYRAGLVVGATFGKCEHLPGKRVEVIDWERVGSPDAVRHEWQEGETIWESGSYSVIMPRSHQALVAVEVTAADGETSFHHLRTNKAGALELGKETVAALCGPVEEMTRVEIPPLYMVHGERVAVQHVSNIPRTGKGRGKAVSDRVQLAAYCADPVGWMRQIRPQPLGMRAIVVNFLLEPGCSAPRATESENEPVSATEPDRPILSPVETPVAPAAVTQPSPAAPLQAPSEAGATVPIEALGEVPAEIGPRRPLEVGDVVKMTHPAYAGEAATVYEKEPASSPLAVTDTGRHIRLGKEGAGWERPDDSNEAAWMTAKGRARVWYGEAVESAAPPPAVERRRRKPAIERLLRRYLAMRRQRAVDRAALAAAGEHLRELEAARPVAPVHQDQDPGYPAIARLHEERAEHQAKERGSAERIAALERAVDSVTGELMEMTGRAHRAEREMRIRPPALLAISYGGARVPEVRYGDVA